MKKPNGKRIALLAPLRPLCAPLHVDQGFSEEIMNRRTPRTAAPWERLGLVYLEERAAPERPKGNTLVNNLTQQIIFRVSLTNRSRRPPEWDSAGFALLKKIFRRIAKMPGMTVWRRDLARLYGAGQGGVSPKELHTALKTLLKQTEETETAGFTESSEETFKRTFRKLLRGISERSRTAVSPDIRLLRQGRTLLKLWTTRYAPARTDGYARFLPPIEYRREQPREQAVPAPSPRSGTVDRRQTRTDPPAITGRLENFSREEINRLADRICTQIETRVLRERRRAGM